MGPVREELQETGEIMVALDVMLEALVPSEEKQKVLVLDLQVA